MLEEQGNFWEFWVGQLLDDCKSLKILRPKSKKVPQTSESHPQKPKVLTSAHTQETAVFEGSCEPQVQADDADELQPAGKKGLGWLSSELGQPCN